MSSRRSYGDRCGIARALDLIGERWALLVIRELMLGPKRFTDLRAGLPQIGPDVLAQRLRELEQAGVVQRRKLPPPAASRVYELTSWGEALEPAVLALGRWGSRAPFLAGSAAFGADSAMLALKTLFAPAAAEGFEARVALRLGQDDFGAHVAAGRLEVARGEPNDPDAVIETEPATLAALLWHGGELQPALDAGKLKLEGDHAAAKRFLELFPPA